MLPILAGLAKIGAPLLFNIIKKKGVDVVKGLVKEKTGIDIEKLSFDAEGNLPPEIASELKRFEMEHEEKLLEIELEKFKVGEQEDTKKMETVNETMQAETQAKDWWSSAWRPFWGFTSAIAFLVVSVFVCVLGYKAIVDADADALTMIPQFITSIAMLFSIPGAILGVTAWHRGKMQRGK